jgi:hypothetical protein
LKSKCEIRTLCYTCKTDYENTGYHIRRAKRGQYEKKLCDFCSKRYGYDYEVAPKERRGGRR